MGCGPSMPIEVVAPTSKMVVIGDQYVFNEPKYFCIKEKFFSFSGDDFDILELSSRQAMFKVNGKALSFRDKKELLDPTGNMILDSTQTLLALAPMHNIYVNDQRLVCIRKQLLNLTVHKFDIFLLHGKGLTRDSPTTETDKMTPDITVHTGMIGKEFAFYAGPDETSPCIGRVSRDFLSFREVVSGKDMYMLTVAPGVDCAFMVQAVAIIDSMINDK